MSADDKILRDHLLELLRGGSAHADPGAILDDFPATLRGAKPAHAPYTPWQLLEHIRFALNDLLVFCTDPKYVAPDWPGDYWRAKDEAASASEWDAAVASVKADLAAFEKLIQDPDANLYAQIPWGSGQTLLREILLVCDHNSYHLGQMVLLRKELGAWNK
jgi:hypothetical protein